MSIANKETNPQKLWGKKPDSINNHSESNEYKSNTIPPRPDNLCNDTVKSVVDKNTFEEKLDPVEEKVRNMSYIHRDIQMRFLKNKKEDLES